MFSVIFKDVIINKNHRKILTFLLPLIQYRKKIQSVLGMTQEHRCCCLFFFRPRWTIIISGAFLVCIFKSAFNEHLYNDIIILIFTLLSDVFVSDYPVAIIALKTTTENIKCYMLDSPYIQLRLRELR